MYIYIQKRYIYIYISFFFVSQLSLSILMYDGYYVKGLHDFLNKTFKLFNLELKNGVSLCRVK